MIDWTKPVRTKGTKRRVRILSLEGPGNQSVVGCLEDEKGEDKDADVYQWFPGGGFSVDPIGSPMDLENVPEKIRYTIQVSAASLGSEPGSTVRWWVMREINNGGPSIFAICYTHDAAETIMHLLNGTK